MSETEQTSLPQEEPLRDQAPIHETEPTDSKEHSKLWNPVVDTRSPTEDQFSAYEVAFCRFVTFLRNRDEAGLSPESVRLLHNFYAELDAATINSSSLSTVLYADCPVHELANHIQIRRQLEARHLGVLINLIMLTVEEEQKTVQILLNFYSGLTLSTDDGDVTGMIHEHIQNYDPENLIKLKALTQEHIRLKVDFIAKLKSGRSLMVKCLDGSHRLLYILRKKAAKHTRKLAHKELTQIRESLQPVPIDENSL